MHTCIYATQDNSSSGKDMTDEGEGEDKLVIHVCTCHLCDGGKKNAKIARCSMIREAKLSSKQMLAFVF